MPASRAASELPPTANVRRPKVVRLSTSHPTTTTGSSTHGDLYELDAIAAVIIGGTLLSGGRGTLIGSVLGVLVFTTITNLFVLNNLASDVQNIAKGLIIIAAVLLQRRSKASSP